MDGYDCRLTDITACMLVLASFVVSRQEYTKGPDRRYLSGRQCNNLAPARGSRTSTKNRDLGETTERDSVRVKWTGISVVWCHVLSISARVVRLVFHLSELIDRAPSSWVYGSFCLDSCFCIFQIACVSYALLVDWLACTTRQIYVGKIN